VKGLVKIVVPLVIQAAIAFALVTFVVSPKMRGEPFPWAKEVASEGEDPAMRELGPLLPIDEILVNVAQTQGRRYFKTSLTLEIEGKDLQTQAEARMPILRGKVIDLLSTKSMEQLVEPAARDSLKKEILETLNANVSGGTFRDLYFTEFLVQ
jgi:flagellar FliL protein